MSTEILHVSDTHLGYRQYHKQEREEDFRAAFERVVDEAIERDVDVVVHAGDMFNRSRPTISALSDFVDQLKRLRDAGIEFCTIVGNHDGTRDRQWPEFFESLDLAVYLNYDGYQVGDVVLYGQDHVEKGQRDRISYQFNDSREGVASFLVAHGLFTPFPHGRWDTNEVLAKSPVEFDGLLLGDDHTPRIDYIGDDEIPITYPGSTERTAADQREKRGYNLVTVDDSGTVSISHETIETRPFQFIDLELDSDDTVDTVISEIESRDIIDDCVLVITLTGDGNRVPSGDIERVGLRRGALVVQVNDRREFEELDTEYDEVTFADPDDAVRERKSELELSPIADQFEQMARDLVGVPQSNLKDMSEEQVAETLDNDGIEGFTGTVASSDTVDSVNDDDDAGDVNSGETSEDWSEEPESNREGRGEKESQTNIGTGDGTEGTMSESDESDSLSQPKQIQFDDLQ